MGLESNLAFVPAWACQVLVFDFDCEVFVGGSFAKGTLTKHGDYDVDVFVRFNKKYEETGKLFQGGYKARRVDKDNYLQYLSVYIHVKNAFETYDGGIENAMKNFDDAYDFAKKYPYSSLGLYEGLKSPFEKIISRDWLEDAFKDQDFKEFAKNCIEFVNFDNKTFDVTFTESAEAKLRRILY